MSSIFPVSELAVMTLFAIALVWLVVEVVRKDPHRYFDVAQRSEIAAQRRVSGTRGADGRTRRDFPSTSIC